MEEALDLSSDRLLNNNNNNNNNNNTRVGQVRKKIEAGGNNDRNGVGIIWQINGGSEINFYTEKNL